MSNESETGKERVHESGSVVSESNAIGATPVRRTGIIVIAVYLVLFSAFLVYSLMQFWPSMAITEGSQNMSSVTYFFWSFSTSDEVRLLAVVAMAGALGSLVHSLRSFYWYVGNHALVLNWVAMYILLPFVGSTLGLVFYFVIRGGFFSPQTTVEQTSPFGFAALAGLVGMFSEQAVLKLKDVAETLLTKPRPGVNSKPQEKG